MVVIINHAGFLLFIKAHEGASEGAYIGMQLSEQRVQRRGARKRQVRDFLGLYGQVTKCIRWMPRRQKAMKDVEICDKLG